MPERTCEGCKRQNEWGCFARPYRVLKEDGTEEERWLNPARLPLTVLGQETWACPRQSIRHDPFYWAKILKFYGMYRKGFLPEAGAIIDQSNKLIEIFRILDDANDQVDREEANRERRRRNRDARAAPPPRQPRAPR